MFSFISVCTYHSADIILRNKRQDDQNRNEDQCSTVIRGRDGRDGRDGQQGLTGASGQQGPKGSEGPAGVKGDKGDAGSSGTTYVRWGRTVCPPGAERIYFGLASGSKVGLGGGTDESLCLPNDPEYLSHDTSNRAMGTLYGVEYVVPASSSYPWIDRRRHNMPCAVCYVNKSTILTIPAKYTCPTGWTREYYGYLTTEHTTPGRNRKDTICVDVDVESVPGSASFTDPSIACFMDVKCSGDGHPCPPYAQRKPLTCAVCSK